MKAYLKKLWLQIVATLHLSDRVVCELSASLGEHDYHDYDDSLEGEPWHMILLTCKRCGKKFYM